ncbi:MAG: endonuclease V [Candidatus Thorarchaeota archaeon]
MDDRVVLRQMADAVRVSQMDADWMDVSRLIGVDVAYAEDLQVACAVSLDRTTLAMLECHHVVSRVWAPYMPGLLSMREGAVMVRALEQMDLRHPVLVDGNGVLHPRRCGLASSIGVELGAVTIGVAKSLLLGRVGERNGDSAPVIVDGDELGRALYLGGRTRPIYVSVGNNISLQTAVDIVRACTRHSVPEPIRLAHMIASSEARRLEGYRES